MFTFNNSIIGDLIKVELNNIKSDAIYEDGTVTRDGVYLSVRCSASSIQHDENITYANKTLTFLCCGDVNVFVASTDLTFPRANNMGKELWVNTSNHDICWREDGINSIINRVYTELCNKLDPVLGINTNINFININQRIINPCKITYTRKNRIINIETN